MHSCGGGGRTGRSLDPLFSFVEAVLRVLDLAQGGGAKVDIKMAPHSGPDSCQKLANLSSRALPCGDSFFPSDTTSGSSKKMSVTVKNCSNGVYCNSNIAQRRNLRFRSIPVAPRVPNSQSK